jgi:eukaryotic-like serine/threonine-protein kinase
MTDRDYKLVRELFLEVVDLDEEARRRRLEVAAGSDDIRRQVEELLGYEKDPRAPSSIPGVASLAPIAEASPEEMPRKIGTYDIVRLIGSGGMGTVYEATQESPRRVVALKVLRSGLVNHEIRRRFEIESELLGRLQHPAIAQIFEAGQDEVSGPFIAMELIEGQALDEWSKERSPSREVVLELMASICEGVQHAHQRGVIHRDLKPGNILVTDEGEPKILDFGIARVIDEEQRSTASRTRFGEVVGTIAYMSPEQASGDPSRIDTRSDVYALGVVAYELLVGQMPHDVKGRSIPAAMTLIATASGPRKIPKERGVPSELETILRTALDADLDRRYGSAADLAADLRRYLRHEPIAAHPPSTWYQLRTFSRRHRTLVASFIAILAAITLGVAGVVIFALESQKQAARAQRQTRRADISREEAQRSSYAASIRAAIAAIDGGRRAEAERTLTEMEVGRRGWEWDHLRARLDTCDTLIPLNSKCVPGQGFDEEGLLLRLRKDGVLLVEEQATTRSFGADVRHFAVSRDGTQMAIAFGDGRIEIHARQAAKGAPPIATRQFEFRNVQELRCTSSGPAVFLRDEKNSKLWAPGEDLVALIAYQRFWRFSPTGEIGVGDSRQIFDVAAGRLAGVLGETTEAVTCAAFSPDGKRIAFGTAHPSVMVFDIASETRTHYFRGPRAKISALAWHPDGDWLFSGDVQGGVDRWDLIRNRLHDTLLGHDEEVLDLMIDGERERIAASTSRSLRIWSTGSGRNAIVRRAHQSYIHEALFSPDGRTIASAAWDRTLRIWDGHNLESRGTLAAGLIGPTALAFTPDSQQVIVSGGWRHARMFSVSPANEPLPDADRPASTLDARAQETSWPGRVGQTTTEFLRKRGLRLSTKKRGPERLSIRRLDRELLREIPYSGRIMRIAANRAESVVAVAHQDGRIEILDPDDWTTRAQLTGHVGPVYALCFSPDGRRLVSGGADRVIRLWDTETWSEVAALRGHEGDLRSLSFGPSGDRLLSTGSDGTLRLWSRQPRHLLLRSSEPSALDSGATSASETLSDEASSGEENLSSQTLPTAVIEGPEGSDFGRRMTVLNQGPIAGSPALLIAAAKSAPRQAGSVELWTGKPPERQWRISGEMEGEKLGQSLLALSDLDGDGCDDFAVSLPSASRGSRLRNGAIDIRSGRTGARLRSIIGKDDEEEIGAKLFLLPDLDRDGVPEILSRPRPSNRERYLRAYSPRTGRLIESWLLPSEREQGVVVLRRGPHSADFALLLVPRGAPVLPLKTWDDGDLSLDALRSLGDGALSLIPLGTSEIGLPPLAALTGPRRPFGAPRQLLGVGGAAQAAWTDIPRRAVVGSPCPVGDVNDDGIIDLGLRRRGRLPEGGNGSRLIIISGRDGLELMQALSAPGDLSFGADAVLFGDQIAISSPRSRPPRVVLLPRPRPEPGR